MHRKLFLSLAMTSALLCAASCRSKSGSPATPAQPPSAAAVDVSRLIHADQDPGNWMSDGRTYSEQRFSPLTQVNDTTVSRLAPDWVVELPIDRGLVSPPDT